MTVTQTKITGTEKRPALVWCAAVFLFAATLLPFLSVMANETARSHFLSQSASQYPAVFAVPVLTLAGAVLLVMSRKFSFYILTIALALDIVKTFYIFSFTNYAAQAGNPALVVLKLVVYWVICVFIIVYARFLIKKGVLK